MRRRDRGKRQIIENDKQEGQRRDGDENEGYEQENKNEKEGYQDDRGAGDGNNHEHTSRGNIKHEKDDCKHRSDVGMVRGPGGRWRGETTEKQDIEEKAKEQTQVRGG